MCTSYHVFPEENVEMRDIINQVTAALPQTPVNTGRIYPSNPAPVLLAPGPAVAHFGLPLTWRKGLQLNARSETAADSRMFAPMLDTGRCLVPANDFYEWTPEKKAHLFSDAKGGLLYMAGLYTRQEGLDYFIIITRAANEHVGPVHDRMPLLLQTPELRRAWLDSPQLARDLLKLPLDTPLTDKIA